MLWAILVLGKTLQWRHNACDGVSHHQPYDCLLNRLYKRKSKKTSKLRVTGLCARNSPVTGEFPAQMASNAETVSIWWRHHGKPLVNCEFCIQCPHLPKASCPDKATCIYSNYSSARSPIASTTHSSPPINVDVENLINNREDTMLHAKYIILVKWCKWFTYI